MEREIKFRAWILTKKEEWTGAENFDTFDWNNRMRFVSYMNIPLNNHSGKDISCHKICENDNYANGWHAVGDKYNEAILMQFTGHYCKGVEIYEGDILSTYCYNKPRKGAVVFGQDGWTCMGYHLNTGFFIGGGDDFKIIGNIYKDPDLL